MSKLLWVDLEMTGLDVEKEVILEVGAIVTDMEMRELETFHAVLKQPQTLLDKMDDWNQKHHKESGLIELVKTSGREPQLVEHDLIMLVQRHFQGERPILAGNSISQDRLFINKYMPRLAEKLHYRMLDVTSWKIILNERFKLKFEKKNGHRAIDDIKESINELKFYISHISPAKKDIDAV